MKPDIDHYTRHHNDGDRFETRKRVYAETYLYFLNKIQRERQSRSCREQSRGRIITTSKLVVCTAPIRGAYWLSPERGIERFDNALLSQAAVHVRLLVFCLFILGTRKRVNIFFDAHLILCKIFFKLIPYVFFDYPFVSAYRIHIVTSTPEIS